MTWRRTPHVVRIEPGATTSVPGAERTAATLASRCVATPVVQEHSRRLGRGLRADRGGHRAVTGGEEEAGVGAELAPAESERAEPARDEPLGVCGARRRDHDGVDAAELAVERDRVGPSHRGVEQGAASRARTGERRRPDAAVGDQAVADGEAVDHGEDTVRRPAGSEGGAMISPHRWLVCGWAGCALTTTGQPAARAEAVSPPGTEKANGKLLAPNTATGPSGTRTTRRSGWPAGGGPATSAS